ncbi:type IV pilus biogenesis/stability protein PilW [Billgrantia diversa]|uniref:type IV pilus biogenesis/stability protein PilW n=1 Tax=Halomonas sp. MCCC 1A13316 TaxID=2733487 RepID=UPI0018A4A25C|nr:type IV pilus biogenesis/stability protein PilW [Halomonas sp. MCCC 1A13316]QOR40120.1 type IV pilus biogenesis/stability protein PilW [Halomonas sp. MCCC 1A13316]
MTRPPYLPSRRMPLVAMVVVTLWLSGCASLAEQQDEAGPTEAFTELGMAYLQRGNLPRAMAALNRALERDPDDPEALQAMAIVYQRQGEREQADKMFQRALAVDSDNSRARNNYAAFLYEYGQVRRACEQLELASRDTRYANRAQLFANLGQCQWDIGEIGEARHSLERARSLDPRNPRSYFTLAALELAQGNPDLARQQLEIFVGLAGMTPDARTLAQQIAAANAQNMTVTPGTDTQRDAP